MMPDIGMDAKDRIKLLKYYGNLIEVLYSCISPHLISKFVLDLEMHADIESKRTERKKMERLMAILPTRGTKAMTEFIAALKPNYSWLANMLEHDDNNNNCSDICNANEDKCRDKLIDISIKNHTRDIEKILQRSTKVCHHWAFLARSLGIQASTVVDIKREMFFSGGLDFAIQKVLDSWIDNFASKATFGKLIQHLQKEGMNQSAEHIEELWSKLQ